MSSFEQFRFVIHTLCEYFRINQTKLDDQNEKRLQIILAKVQENIVENDEEKILRTENIFATQYGPQYLDSFQTKVPDFLSLYNNWFRPSQRRKFEEQENLACSSSDKYKITKDSNNSESGNKNDYLSSRRINAS